MSTHLQDKNATMRVLGALMNDPTLLEQVAEFPISPVDFESRFEKTIFAAINNLYSSGAKVITVMEIDSYLMSAPNLHQIFTEGNGIDYLNDAVEVGEVANYNYFHGRLRKFSALRSLEAVGYSCDDIYPEFIDDPRERIKIQERFDKMQITDIFNYKMGNVLNKARDYNSGTEPGGKVADGIREQFKMMRKKKEIGPPLMGMHYNSIIRGARKKIFHLNSGSTGSGKSRRLVGDAVHQAIPYRFNWETGEWEDTGNSQKVLIITTELTIEEVRALIMAYVSGINEAKFLDMELSEQEEIIHEQSLNIICAFADNLYLERVADPSVSSVSGVIRQYVGLEKVESVFFDYIYASQALRREFQGLNMRTDEMLLTFATELKNIANELSVFVSSATQLSDGYQEEMDGIKDQRFLRGAKSMADKIDFGEITLRLSRKEKERFKELCGDFGSEMPTHVSDVYKVRRSPYNQVRVWWKMDLGTCRMKTIMVTDSSGYPVDGFKLLNYRMDNEYISLEEGLVFDESGEAETRVVEEPDNRPLAETWF